MNQSHQLYEDVQQKLTRGWDTWDTRSVLTHVHLPSGLALRLGIKEYRDGGHLREALIGRLGHDAETVVPDTAAATSTPSAFTIRTRCSISSR